MTKRALHGDTAQPPDDMAAFWMARKMSGSMNAEERRNFDQWLGDDPANRAAFAELEHIMSLADLADSDLLAEEFERELGQLARDDAARTQRFTAIAASFLLAAIAVTGALFLKNAGRPEAAVYATAVGVARQVNLDDGTQIDLNTDSRIEVAYTKAKRAVSLAGGSSRQRRQATAPPCRVGPRAGTSLRQRSIACGQRVWKWQPGGGRIGLGTSPCSRMCWRLTCGSGIGTADSSASVYGWRGLAYRSLAGAISTMRPRYITATRSLMCSTTLRSWAMKM